MAQARPRLDDQGQARPVPIKYGQVFAVTGNLADQPITPRDTAAMLSAEAGVPGAALGRAAYNQAVGAVRTGQASDIAYNQGVSISQTPVPGGRIVTEFVADRVVGQYSVADLSTGGGSEYAGSVDNDETKVKITEALEATARAIRDQPVDRADAAAIRSAETRAIGSDVIIPGGIAEQAQAAADANAWATDDDVKVKVGDVLSWDATAKLPMDKAVTREDAAKAVEAEAFTRARSDGKPCASGRP